ncbi:MAG: phosphotransferase family protein [Pseudomonadota bacterium]
MSAYVAREVPSVGRVHAIEKFQGGQSNPTFRLETDGGAVVLRAKPPGALLKSAHQVDREHRVMSALRATEVPVPEMLHLSGDGDGSPIGRQFFLMRFVDGVIHWDPSLETLDPDGRRAVTDSMNRTLAALHRVDPEAVGLGDFGRPGNYFARQLSRWTKQYRASETDPIAAMDRLIGWLEAGLPDDDGSVSLVHGDFRLDNMMFDTKTHDVVAVLDWELSTLGHPVADLAYQCMQWRLPADSAFRGLGGLDRAGLGLPVEADYVDRYCERTGREAIANWNYHLAFNFFRLGAILQGVYKRALDGNASNPERGRRMGEAVPLLAAVALDTIETQP